MSECWAGQYCRKTGQPVCNEFCSGYVILDTLYRQSNIPKRYQRPIKIKASSCDRDAHTELIKIRDNIVEWVNSGKNLMLWGETKGNGKTTWACALASAYIRSMVYTTNLEPVVYFIKTAKFLEEIRSQFENPTPEFPETLKLVENVPLLIIDDIGAERTTEWVRERLLNIIDERYSNNRSTIYTSNCSQSQLIETLHGRIIDRIKDAKSLQLTAASWRGVDND